MIPTFAVVGHPNKGKSSIVATLAENDRTSISDSPGTTRNANRYTFCIDGIPQYDLVDTPGFQRAGAVLAWLEQEKIAIHERPARVEEFVEAHREDLRFHDECELLTPILEGAGILYVVDGAKPYGPEYELEMEVLRWTGRPRMALINLIGEGDYIDQWRDALGQYFSIVRVFDAVHADFSKRIALLTAFAELDEQWRAVLERAVVAIETEREHRRKQSANEIADSIVDVLNFLEKIPLGQEVEDTRPLEAQLSTKLQQRIRRRENQARDIVQNVYGHTRLARDENAADIISMDLFTEQGWELFGLSRTQILISGAVSGALAGSGVDVLLGGTSLLLGSGIGGLVGGVGAWLGSNELAQVKVIGKELGGRILQVGPVTAVNFPWVMLGRAWMHHSLVAERNHARRQVMLIDLSTDTNLMDSIEDGLRKDLAVQFKLLKKSPPTPKLRRELSLAVNKLLKLMPEKKS